MCSFFQTEAVEEKIGVLFRDKALLMLAFVHRSFWNENQHLVSGHNERLEFLGDSVLGLIVAEYLYLKHPTLDEGSLSSLRSQMVDASACSIYVQQLELEEYLLLGKGEQMKRDKGRESILADLFEALIGSLYLDQGLSAAKVFFFSHFTGNIRQMILKPARNWKAELQDYSQKTYQQTPIYEVIEESGPPHRKTFWVAVWINERKLGEGKGFSKKEAQTNAAKQAMEELFQK
ncbi:MAG: ribonuclease III [Chlamydiales bacterium]